MPLLDLTHELHEDIPVAPILPPARFEPTLSSDPGASNVTMCSLPSHCGTHVDAPSHFIASGRTIENVPLEWLVGRASAVEPRNGRENSVWQ